MQAMNMTADLAAREISPALRIVDTTLREGEQFARAHFTSEQRCDLARRLDAFGVDILELPSPRVSPQTIGDVRAIAAMGLRARVVTHVRCAAEDVEQALTTGVEGVHLFFGTSPQLRTYGHGRSLEHVAESAVCQVRRVREAGLYVRFSAEDAFRTELDDLLPIFDAVVAAGVDCIGLPDTVGIAMPRQVTERVALMRARYPGTGIEFHGHNDTGCAVANALAALEAGADHIDVTVLGIGERNGIASLSGVVAALYPRRRDLLARYDLTRLPELDRHAAGLLGIPIPFNSPITGESAFSHRAGIHTNAVLRAPVAYEALDPASFGLTRHVDSASRVVGRHALAARAAELRLALDDEQALSALAEVKRLADSEPLEQALVDDVLRAHAGASPRPEVARRGQHREAE
jgi:homocitrate synthase